MICLIALSYVLLSTLLCSWYINDSLQHVMLSRFARRRQPIFALAATTIVILTWHYLDTSRDYSNCVSSPYQDNPRFFDDYKYVLQPSFKCNLHTSNLLVFVPSAVHKSEERSDFRKRFSAKLPPGTDVFFILGVSQIDHIASKRLLDEQSRNNDLVGASFVDNYFNLSLKTHAALYWIANHYPCFNNNQVTAVNMTSKTRSRQQRSAHDSAAAPHYSSTADAQQNLLILRTDIDVHFNDARLLDFLREIRLHSNARTNKPTVWGEVREGASPFRSCSSKWYMPVKTYAQSTYPAFVNGPVAVWTSSAVRLVSQGALGRPYMHLEDVYFTGILAAASQVQRIHTVKFTDNFFSIMLSCQLCAIHKPVPYFNLQWYLATTTIQHSTCVFSSFLLIFIGLLITFSFAILIRRNIHSC